MQRLGVLGQGCLLLAFLVFHPQLSQAVSTPAWRYPDAASAWELKGGEWHFLPVAKRWQARRSQQYPVPKWSVDVDKGDLLTVVVPLKGSELELGYVRNQLESFDQLMDVTALREYLLIVPPKDLEKVKRFMTPVIHSLSNILKFPVRLVSETLCVPELLPDSAYASKAKEWPGWLIQQVVKLASVELVETPYMLLLDADIFVGRPTHPVDLFETGQCTSSSPVCDEQRKTEYKGKIEGVPISVGDNYHFRWWANTATTLQLEIDFKEWDFALGVTPQVISTDLAKQLGHWIQNRFDVPSWRGYLLEIASAWDRHVASLRQPGEWSEEPAFTEYALLYIYGLHAGNFFQYHSRTQLSMGNEVWYDEAWEAWDPCKGIEDPDGRGFFSLVQSRMEKDPDEILARLKECWQSLSPSVQRQRLKVSVSKHSSD